MSNVYPNSCCIATHVCNGTPCPQVYVAGQYITVLLDPNSYDDVLYDTDSFDSRRSKGLLMEKVFSLVLPSDNPEKERKWMEG